MESERHIDVYFVPLATALLGNKSVSVKPRGAGPTSQHHQKELLLMIDHI